MMSEEPDNMVARSGATGKPVTDPEPTEPTDVSPEVVEQHRDEIEQAKADRKEK